MKRIVNRLLIFAGAAVLAALLVYGSGWLLSFRFGGPSVIPEAATLPALPEAEVGAPVPGVFELDLPLCRSVFEASVKTGDGSVQAGPVRIESGSWRYWRRNWRVTFDLRALRAGKIAAGTLTLKLAGPNPETVERPIPGFTAVAPKIAPPGGELEPAGAIEIPKPTPWGWISAGAGALLIVAGAAIFLLTRRRRPEPSLRERMEEALRKLRMGLASGEVTPEQGYISLTDLVRGYLEERYGIPVSTRTTPEFLADVNGPDSPLPKPERPFLREFLEASDKVKFAALTPDTELLENAIDSAVQLVAVTAPVPAGTATETERKGDAK